MERNKVEDTMAKTTLTQQMLDKHLFWACEDGNPRYAGLAISAGANVNVTDYRGQTPL